MEQEFLQFFSQIMHLLNYNTDLISSTVWIWIAWTILDTNRANLDFAADLEQTDHKIRFSFEHKFRDITKIER
jgi:transglutaminase-like putative cysteine protease